MFGNFDIHNLLLMVVPVLLALTVHEYAHGLAAWKLGDDTAKREGRLTLNPISHLDPIGTVMLFLFRFGWAKPVPFDPRNFKNPVRDTTLVALAGPASNFLTALILTLAYKLLLMVNLFSLLPSSLAGNLSQVFVLAIIVNVSLGIFNLIPVPPLDGFKVLAYFLPAQVVQKAYQNSLWIMIAFVILLSTGLLSKLLWPAVDFILSLLNGILR